MGNLLALVNLADQEPVASWITYIPPRGLKSHPERQNRWSGSVCLRLPTTKNMHLRHWSRLGTQAMTSWMQWPQRSQLGGHDSLPSLRMGASPSRTQGIATRGLWLYPYPRVYPYQTHTRGSSTGSGDHWCLCTLFYPYRREVFCYTVTSLLHKQESCIVKDLLWTNWHRLFWN